MSLRRNIANVQILLNQGVDLLLLRLRMLQLDICSQAATAMRIFIAVVSIGALFVLGMVSLLLGINHILADNDVKTWVFFGLAVFSLLLIIGLALWSVLSWKAKSAQVLLTLNNIQRDIAYLRSGVKQDKKGVEKNESKI